MFAAGPALSTRLFVAVTMALILMILDHRTSVLQPLRSFISIVTYPIYLLADAPQEVSQWITEVTADEQTILEQNQELKKEKMRLKARLQKLKALEAENLRLRNLLDSSFKVGERVLIAELSSVELDPYRQQIVISKGSRSGVFKGQPVLDANAVMGQVVSTSPLHSTVMLITDASHALPVQVLRNGLRTVAVGTGNIDSLNLPFLARNADIVQGDQLVTSGLGGIFPPGYPVATVTSVTQEPGQHFATISAEPLAHLDRAREVLLVWIIKQQALKDDGKTPRENQPDNGQENTPEETEPPETDSSPTSGQDDNAT
ncbi:MAG: rod shape-determining protein MreC [Gammaproteobacteria bacterium]